MRLHVCKKYNRAEHSYLMVLTVEADDMDPNVFVVKDQPLRSPGTSSSSIPSTSSEIPDGMDSSSSI